MESNEAVVIEEETAKTAELEEFMAAHTTVVVPTKQEQPPMISDDNLVCLFDEILTNCRDDRKEIGQLLSNFVEMVLNDGDATTASKEALVNLIKIKSEISDKMAKVADMMLSVNLKEKTPGKISANQTNHYHFGDRRSLLDAISKAEKRKKKE